MRKSLFQQICVRAGWVVLAAAAVGLPGCHSSGQTAGVIARQAALELAEADLGRTAEARAFMEDRGAVVQSEDIPVDRLRKHVEALYAAGALEVRFAGIKSLDRKRVSSWLVVRLPQDPGHRQAILQVADALTDTYFGKDHRSSLPKGEWFGLALDERPPPQQAVP